MVPVHPDVDLVDNGFSDAIGYDLEQTGIEIELAPVPIAEIDVDPAFTGWSFQSDVGHHKFLFSVSSCFSASASVRSSAVASWLMRRSASASRTIGTATETTSGCLTECSTRSGR